MTLKDAIKRIEALERELSLLKMQQAGRIEYHFHTYPAQPVPQYVPQYPQYIPTFPAYPYIVCGNGTAING